MSTSLIDATITRDQLVEWGALRMYSQRHVDRWLSNKKTLSVGDMLSIDTAGGRLLWAIMRPEVLPAELIHQCGIDLARYHLSLVDANHTYVDLRSRKAARAKQAWLDGDLSLGGLMYARRRAEAAAELVAELKDPMAHDTAQILAVVTHTDPSWTFRQIYYRHRDQFSSKEADQTVLQNVRNRIASW